MSVGILIADDHPVVRKGVGMILRADPRLRVVAEAEDGAEALTLGLRSDVDLAILDMAMPRLTGLEVTQQLVAARPTLRVLILSMYDDPRYIKRARRVGAHGYLLKSTVDRELLSACRAVLAGGAFVQPQAPPVSQPIPPAADAEDGILTARETQVVALIAAGRTSREIAEQLTISTKTVDRHRDNVMAKLEIHNRAELTRYAIRAGIATA
jgi:DNA-binding NarL/FixJ family response regulator